MVNVIFGIGKRRNFIKNGKLTIMYVFLRYGILMSLRDLQQLVGTEKLSIGINSVYI